MKQPSTAGGFKKPGQILHAAAYLAVVGIALAEGLQLWPDIRLYPTLALLALYTALLAFSFRVMGRQDKKLFIALTIAETLSGVGVMVLGSGYSLGSALFFILGTLVAMSLPLLWALAWETVFLGLIVFGFTYHASEGWFPLFLSLVPAFFGLVSFSFALKSSHEARAESQRLLAELTAAQDQLRSMAVLEERERLAREMHDSVGHRLTVATVQLEGAARLVSRDPDRAEHMIETSRDQVREGLAELRRAVSALRSTGEGSGPLAETLHALAAAFQRASATSVELRIAPGFAEPDAERRLVIVRTAQEGLTNVQKHAEATRIEMSVALKGGAYLFSCADNGRGPAGGPRDPLAASGFGLRNLGERAAAFGGRVELKAREGGGADLVLVLPTGLG